MINDMTGRWSRESSKEDPDYNTRPDKNKNEIPYDWA